MMKMHAQFKHTGCFVALVTNNALACMWSNSCCLHRDKSISKYVDATALKGIKEASSYPGR